MNNYKDRLLIYINGIKATDSDVEILTKRIKEGKEKTYGKIIKRGIVEFRTVG